MAGDQRTTSQLEIAQRMLAAEGAGGDAAEPARAAAQVFDKLHFHLDPLVGVAGLHALLQRSAKLVQAEFDWLDAAAVESATALRARLETQDPAISSKAAAALFATFLAVIARFIGDRLTAAALMDAWPWIDPAPRETQK